MRNRTNDVCRHLDRPHQAKGLCLQCYHAAHYIANKDRINAKSARYVATPHGKLIAAWSSACWGARKNEEPVPERPTRACPEVCEVCEGPPSKGQRLHMDHDHKTGKFRGWLCGSCNRALGFLKDDPSRLQLLLDYLEVRE